MYTSRPPGSYLAATPSYRAGPMRAMLASFHRGAAPAARLRTHPSNLLRVMPAKEVSECVSSEEPRRRAKPGLARREPTQLLDRVLR